MGLRCWIRRVLNDLQRLRLFHLQRWFLTQVGLIWWLCDQREISSGSCCPGTVAARPARSRREDRWAVHEEPPCESASFEPRACDGSLRSSEACVCCVFGAGCFVGLLRPSAGRWGPALLHTPLKSCGSQGHLLSQRDIWTEGTRTCCASAFT